MQWRYKNLLVKSSYGDIVEVLDPAIVCPTDIFFQLRKGITDRICACAGLQFRTMCQELFWKNDPVMPGQVFSTPAFNLNKIKFIILVVLPSCPGCQASCQLEAAIYHCFRHAEFLNVSSLALPELGSENHFGFSFLAMCKAYVRAIKKFFQPQTCCATLQQISFVFREFSNHKTFSYFLNDDLEFNSTMLCSCNLK